MSAPLESQPTPPQKRPGRKSVTIVTPAPEGIPHASAAVAESSRCHSTEQLTQHHHHHSQPHRKVSFSDVVVTSRQVSVEDLIGEAGADYPNGPLTTGSTEQITLVDRSGEEPIDDSGHHITVRLVVDPGQDEVTQTNPSLCSTSLPVYVARLGMLKQATLYQIEFHVPDSLPSSPGDVELVRLVEEGPGRVAAPVNVGATVELVECTVVPEPGHGHDLVLRLATTKQTEVNEAFTMRLVDRPSEAVHVVLHGLSMRRGQGTPFLRIGIHRISENSAYPDSDEFTEWPGFNVSLNDDDEELAVGAPAANTTAHPPGDTASSTVDGEQAAMQFDGGQELQSVVASTAQGDKASTEPAQHMEQ